MTLNITLASAFCQAKVLKTAANLDYVVQFYDDTAEDFQILGKLEHLRQDAARHNTPRTSVLRNEPW
jgi:hypothetical protein